MFRSLCLVFVAAAVLFAEDAWKDKPIPQWNEEDARQVLAASPWVKYATPQWVNDLSPDERRNGGDMEAGTHPGVGLEGLVGIFNPQKAAEAVAKSHAKPQEAPVAVRWESAQPVRTAETKVKAADAPKLTREDYAIAIYDVPTPKRWNLANELKGVAFLRRDKKKDLKPSRVEILRANEDDKTATIVYYFPRSVEISKRDGWLVFGAQIGRLFVSQNFFAGEMVVRGDLEL